MVKPWTRNIERMESVLITHLILLAYWSITPVFSISFTTIFTLPTRM